MGYIGIYKFWIYYSNLVEYTSYSAVGVNIKLNLDKFQHLQWANANGCDSFIGHYTFIDIHQ